MAEFVHKPGDHVRWYAKKKGWSLARANVMVEGLHDQNYFQLASDLYCKQHGLMLVGKNLSLFPSGLGNNGGTEGIEKCFPMLRELIATDVDNDKQLFRVVALLDDDTRGRATLNVLTRRNLNFSQNKDIFLLKREYTSKQTRDPRQLANLIEKANEAWKDLHCVIEDLLSWDILSAFCEEYPNCRPNTQLRLPGAHHLGFAMHAKAPLFRFVCEHAVLKDVDRLLDTLKFLRWCLGLPPKGDS
jgi:hypothetical protein